MSLDNRGASATTTFRVRNLLPEEESEQPDWTGDSIRVTNCDYEGCEKEPNVLFDKDLIPIEYTCRAQLQNTISMGAMSEIQLEVDYEALIPLLADPIENERSLQWRLLLAAVEEVGLDKCDFDKQRTKSSTRRSLETLGASTTLYAIRSDLDSSSSLEIPCLYLEQGSDTQCIPVQTVLTLKYHGEQADGWQVQEYVRDLLEKSMLNDAEDLYVKDVEGLQYVGDFDLASSKQGPSGSSSPRPPGGSSVVRIGTIISAASAVMLLISILIFRRRPYKDDDEVMTEAGENEKNNVEFVSDLEAGETTMTQPEVVTSSSSDSNKANSSGASSSPTDEEYAYDERDLTTDTGLVATSSSDSDERHKTSLEVPFPLPPRPPRRGSVPLKKTRRRRKKRKKRPGLKRVNSRENISTMEAIPESDDGSEFESEGSDYSTDDDGSSNQSSSTCNTPVRTRSLPGSRSSSPSTRSDRHFSDTDENKGGVKAVIEALDFLFDGAEDGKEPTTANNHKKTPRHESATLSSSIPDLLPSNSSSPVSCTKKEKKIRPIPPPWV